MSHRYFPHTPDDVEAMLLACGVNNIDDLYVDVPDSLKFKKEYNLPSEMSETEIDRYFRNILKKNRRFETILAGAGYYSHRTPSVIPYLTSRSEFLTAYTPYQPEISQGTLQYIFEFQSMMTQLTGLEISNASMYDGATATAEAMIMAVSNARKKNRVLISSVMNPKVLKVVQTYAHYHGITLEFLKTDQNGSTSKEELESELTKGDVAGVIVSTPNFYGILEDFSGWADICHQNKALLIMNCIPSTLVSIKSPGEWGADIAVGDAQSLGLPLSFGGPYLGFICCTKALMRKIPGRIVGATVDNKGRRSFVLTLQAREQHIRREKATSNICSNQGLMALCVTIYLSLMGKDGLEESNKISYDGAHWLAKELCATGKLKMTFPSSVFFNEFCVTAHEEVLNKITALAMENDILPGVRIDKDKLLIAVTETTDKKQLEKFIKIVQTA